MRLAVIGYGSIGRELCGLMARDARIRPTALALVVKPGREAAAEAAASASGPYADEGVRVFSDADALLDWGPDLVVEAAGHGAVDVFCPRTLKSGVDTIVASVGSLAEPARDGALRAAAAEGAARLILPAGAVGGVDVIGALKHCGAETLDYRGIKPPAAWRGTAAETVCDLDAIVAPTVIFEGDARQAALAYPKNANVAATLALAGPGFEATRVTLIADPAAAGNIHEYTLTTEAAEVTMRIANQPTRGNAKTSIGTVYSLARAVENWRGPVVL